MLVKFKEFFLNRNVQFILALLLIVVIFIFVIFSITGVGINKPKDFTEDLKTLQKDVNNLNIKVDTLSTKWNSFDPKIEAKINSLKTIKVKYEKDSIAINSSDSSIDNFISSSLQKRK